MKRSKDGSILNYFSKLTKIQDTVNQDDNENPSSSEILTEVVTIEEGNTTQNEPMASNTPDSSTFVPPTDIKFYNPFLMNEEERINALNQLDYPDISYEYPATFMIDRNRKFQSKWFHLYPWLYYSKSTDSVYCKFCYFYGKGCGGKFVQSGFKNWRKSLESFEAHQKAGYHLKSASIVATRNSILDGKLKPINEIIDKELDIQKQKNQEMIVPIIEAIILCGRQNISLRGKHDSGPLFSTEAHVNDGNLRSLLRWRAHSDDKFKELTKNAPKNASYLSPTIQNEVILIIEKIIINRRMSKLKNSTFFSIFADESADRANIEQLALGVRYYDFEQNIVNEDFLKFIQITNQTALGISTEIMTAFSEMDINLQNCVGQGYDGAAVMSGEKSGVAKRIRDKFPSAIYVHCMSHSLNLALTDSCNISLLKGCNDIIKQIFNFFNTPKRQQVLLESIQEKCSESTKKKLKNVCPTRFIERHQTTATFIELFDAVVCALQHIIDWNDGTSHTAIGFLDSILSFQFVIALLTLDFALSYTVGLSRYLQTSSIDLTQAISSASDIIDSFREIEAESKNEFQKIFLTAKEVAERHQIEIRKPRYSGRPRSDGTNIEIDMYYHNLLFQPLVQSFCHELEERFQKHRNILESFRLILSHNSCTDAELKTGIDHILCFYSEFIQVSNTQLLAEIKMWNLKLSKLDEKPSSVVEHIKCCNGVFFPNVLKLLLILVVLPVTNCTLERSFSKLNKIKSTDRSTMTEDRLNGLVLLSIYRDEPIDVNEVMQEMAKSARKIKFNV